MGTHLDSILKIKEEEIQRLEPHAADLRKMALKRDHFRGFKRVLDQPGTPILIGEIKKASPSTGVLFEDYDPITLAREYQRAGANALSILTDKTFFHGDINDLQDVRRQVDLPCLRKDFIISPLQIYESVIAQADAILLIVAAFKGKEQKLEDLFNLSQDMQLDVLVEVHNLDEMDTALDIGAEIIGINHRNLNDLTVDLGVSEDLAQEIPSDCLGVAESGIKTKEDIRFLQDQGLFCYLMGETFLRAPDIKAKVKEILG